MSAQPALVEAPERDLRSRLRRDPRLVAITAAAGVLYLGTAALTFGLRVEHLVIAALALAAAAWSPGTRRLLLALAPFLIAGAIYDLSRLGAGFVESRTVHVREPYLADAWLFGVELDGARVPPHEIFLRRHWPAVDFVTGLAYILYLYIPVAITLYLQLGRPEPSARELGIGLGRAFVVLNLASFLTYFLYPAAPPWYVALHGFGQPQFPVVSNPAATVRWDALTGIPYFETFYTRGAHVFGAIPSLHVAIPALAFLYVRPLGCRWLTWGTLAFLLLVSFSAVYLQHHYVVDLLAGASFALGAFAAERRWAKRRLLRKG